MSARETYEKLVNFQKETAIFGSVMAVLGWDLRVNLPPKGVKHRSEQIATLTKLLHQRATDPRIGEWLAELEASNLVKDPERAEAVNINWWRWEYDRITKIPEALAVERSRVVAQAEKAWEAARNNDDFKTFEPWLEKVVRIVREIAACLGYEKEPYDALLDTYERGMRTGKLDALFAPLREETPALVAAIADSPHQPDPSILHRHYPVDAQKAFIRKVLERIGYDYEAGRLDPTVHPFATRFGPGDVRITTRYYEDFFNPAFFGSVHEAGHALYEQGLPADRFGEPLGESVSLGVHESQSRLWENFVARSPAFWDFFYPEAQKTFDALKDVPQSDFVFAINRVKPSTIRVEADEVTYNLHILLRYELEREVLRENLNVADLPGRPFADTSDLFRPATARASCKMSTGRAAPSDTFRLIRSAISTRRSFLRRPRATSATSTRCYPTAILPLFSTGSAKTSIPAAVNIFPRPSSKKSPAARPALFPSSPTCAANSPPSIASKPFPAAGSLYLPRVIIGALTPA